MEFVFQIEGLQNQPLQIIENLFYMVVSFKKQLSQNV